MSINNDRPSPSRPSLLGAAQTSAVSPPDSNRVLAHLEGRKPSSSFSSNAKAIGAGTLAAVLIGTGGFWAWQHQGTQESVLPQLSSNTTIALAAPVPAPAVSEPDTPEAPTPPEPAPSAQAARILEAPLDTTAVSSKPHPADSSPPSAAQPASRHTAPRQSRSSSGKKPVVLQASAASAKKHSQKTKASQAVNPSQASARQAPPAQQRSQRAAKPDPDAELLTTLLQRKDPREVSTQK